MKGATAEHALDPDRWRDLVCPKAAAQLVDAIDTLADFPVLDGTVNRVIAIADDSNTTTADLVSVLEGDPTFAANLLRLANSAAMARPIQAKTVRQAVMLVGRRTLRRLALEAATYRFIERFPGGGGRLRGEMHLHAISIAAVSAATAETVGNGGEGAHLGGLLCDIGTLVLPMAFGEEPCDEIAELGVEGGARALAERERFGIDHAFAGALLADRWGVPPDISAAIAWHHGGPSGVGSPSSGVACVQIGVEIAQAVAGGRPDHALLETALESAGLPPTALDSLADHTVPATVTVAGPVELARQLSEVDGLSQTDELTGVDNRRHWLQATRAALATDADGAVIVCELADGAGGARPADGALVEAARIASRHGRAGRLTTSSFGVWLPATAGDAAQVSGDLAAALVAALGAGAGTSVRVGCATVADHGPYLGLLLEAAGADASAEPELPAPVPRSLYGGLAKTA